MNVSARYLAPGLLIMAGLLAFPTRSRPASQAPTEPEDSRDVRSLLARYCFKCHGPDEKTRKKKLRLDVPVKPGDPVIAPGKPEQSELLARVFSEDPETVMPPASTKLKL